MSKPRVVFVAPTLYPIFSGRTDIKGAGGAEVQQTEIIRLLTGMGYPVGVITGDFGQPDRDEHNGVVMDKLPAMGGRGIKGIRFIHPRLTDYLPLLRRQQPDVIYTRCAAAQVAVCAYYAKRAGSKLIYHGANDLDFAMGRIPGMSKRDTVLFRWGLRRADLVIVQNTAQQELLRSHWGRQGVVVPSSYEDLAARRAAFDGPILLVGNVKPIKRPELFVRLSQALPQRRFKIVGGSAGGLKGRHFFDEIQRACASLDNVEMVGFVPVSQVGKQFDGGSVLINVSETEGFPNTFLQAWARGMPTLSFVAPRDEHGVTGTQVASDFDDMLRRLQALTSDRGEWERASAVGEAQYHRHHSSAAAAATYDRLLSELCGGD
jgi:glycosyltransferase involved in cell wall biosynthesis